MLAVVVLRRVFVYLGWTWRLIAVGVSCLFCWTQVLSFTGESPWHLLLNNYLLAGLQNGK